MDIAGHGERERRAHAARRVSRAACARPAGAIRVFSRAGFARALLACCTALALSCASVLPASATQTAGAAAQDAQGSQQPQDAAATGQPADTSAQAQDAADGADGAAASEDAAGQQALSEADAGKIAEAAAAEDEADAFAAKLPSLRSSLEAVVSSFSGASSIVEDYTDKIAAVEERSQAAKERADKAEQVLDAIEREKEGGPRVSTSSLSGLLNAAAFAADIDSRDYLLAKVAASQRQVACEASVEQVALAAEVRALKAEENELLAAEAQDRETAIANGNEKAAAIEQAAGEMRGKDQSAVRAVEGLDAGNPEVAAAQEQARSSQSSHASARTSALATAAKWYDLVDALSGTQGALSFGCGADFSMAKEAFTKKWGDAIDAFYAQFGSTAGFTPPLQGHGAEMAAAAYDRKIDPRLCAAVSIAESSGGKYCIKSCNAWGWGAADSDPYGGASAWDSWGSAIEAWHEGMATSKTGLATAATIGDLGEIYCSSHAWASTVSQQMEKISALAKSGE